ncbi:MAG: hypothetical protein JOZ47_07310 [Kutzneria sp.]|nr:hypothetical protein [Kutzneria sp.]MBV9844865.1 hypothetical protein [Kutzneria sp.]
MSNNSVLLEPLVGLEWSEAVELAGGVDTVTGPADIRRAWIHRTSERQVVRLYQSLSRVQSDLPAPWWLRALAAGELSTRDAAFALEDEVGELLGARRGWVYMPWTGHGEDGYWEFVPSEEGSTGTTPIAPTTVLFTTSHHGWLDVVPAHGDTGAQRLPVDGVDDLRARLDDIETF